MGKTRDVNCNFCDKRLITGATVPQEWISFCGDACASKWAMSQDFSEEPLASIPVQQLGLNRITTAETVYELKDSETQDSMSGDIATQIENGGTSQPYGD